MSIIFELMFFFVAIGVVKTVSSRPERRTMEIEGDAGRPTGLKEVFNLLEKPRRICRHSFTPANTGSNICEQEFECAGCRVNQHALETSAAPDFDGQGCFYHRGHTWVRIGMDGLVCVGLDHLSALFLTSKRDLLIPNPGSFVTQGEVAMGILTESGEVIPVLSPISGQVKYANRDFGQTTGGQVSDEGPWAFVVRPFDLTREVRPLLCGGQARRWLKHEDDWLRGMLYGADATAADGGRLCLSETLDIPWDRLRTEFFVSG